METHIFFGPEQRRIEGLVSLNGRNRGVVITHPHPLYGGEMTHPVVEAVAFAYHRRGFSTLRFNFRGAGRSMGVYDHGPGEQDDVRTAVAYLREQGVETVDLAGYSFGTWINAGVGCPDAGRMIMISPAVNFLDYDGVQSLPCLSLVVVGDADGYAGAERVQTCARKWNPEAEVVILHDVDHFYNGAIRDLERVLKAFLMDEKA